MKVLKRNGRYENAQSIKVEKRIKKICSVNKLKNVDAFELAQKVIARIIDGITTSEIDTITSEIAISMSVREYEYSLVASNIIASNIHKNTNSSFYETMEELYLNDSIISKQLFDYIQIHKDLIEKEINYNRDYLFDYFGIKTLEKSYLFKIRGRLVERPQHMWMRVSLGIHIDDIDSAIETYHLLSTLQFIHASPTLFNTGTKRQQLSSCFLIGTEDSIDGIYKTISDCAKISKYAGGIGVHTTNVRSKGSYIKGTNGYSDGLIPMLKVYNETMRYVNQCFSPETIVYTDSGPKQIQYITINDKVITIDGTFKKVNEVISNDIEEKEILEMTHTGTVSPIKLTKEHNLYIIKKDDYSKTPRFIKANEIEVGDYIGFPKLQSCDIITSDINSLKYYKMYGIIINYGQLLDNNLYNIYINEYSNEYNFITDFFIENCIEYKTSRDNISGNTIICITFDNTILGFPSINKIPGYILNLSNDIIKSILSGIGFFNTRDDFVFFTTYTDLVYQIKYLLLRLDYVTKVSVERVFNKFMYSLNIITSIEDPIYWTDITHINKIQYTGSVYDLNIQDNHNYLTDLGLVHNSGRRKGSAAIYLEPWHADILDFLELKKNTGSEELRTRDLFLSMFVNDLFMKKVKNNDYWYLMCPNECKDLTNSYGEEFEENYNRYVEKGVYKEKIKALDLFEKIIESQIETGIPYMVYKDHVNNKNNQSNLGVIKSSNLCAEVCLYSDHKEYGTCLTGDTMILTKQGRIRLDECHNKEVLTYLETDTSNNIKPNYIKAKLIDNGEKDVYEVSIVNPHPSFSGNGVKIKATLDHKFLVYKYRDIFEWKELKDICMDDHLIYFNDKDLHLFDKNEFIKQYHYINNKYHFEMTYKIDSIEYKGKEKVYDLNVPIAHNFIANGIVVHNCNIATLSLPSYVDKNGVINYKRLGNNTRVLVKNLNKIIDINFYPVPETELSNKKNRPIIIGVQGLYDLFMLMKIPFESDAAKQVNKDIFETIYYYAVAESIELAKKYGPYQTFKDSPLSRGKFQYSHWGLKTSDLKLDWGQLEKDVIKYGIRNSMLTGLPPTASTSQILGNIESFEPITSNIYTRQTLSGTFPIINKYLIADLHKLKLSRETINNIIDKIIQEQGSVQHIDELPQELKELYKTVWEIKQRSLINLSADRGPFIDHSQSLNLFFDKPTPSKIGRAHVAGWEAGLKTGMYYLRTKPASKTEQFTTKSITTSDKVNKWIENINDAKMICSMENKEACSMCSG